MGCWLPYLQAFLFICICNHCDNLLVHSQLADDSNIDAIGVGKLQKQSFHDLYRAAVQLLDTGDWINSLQYLKKAAEFDADHVETNQLIGTLEVKLGNTDRGIQYLERANRDSEGRHPGIVSNLIEALRMVGRVNDGRTVGRAFISLLVNPQVPLQEALLSIYINLALTEKQLKDYQAAAELLFPVVETNPGNRDMWVTLADCLMHFDHAAAESLLRRALPLFPQDVHFYYLLGTALHHQLKLDEAMSVYFRGEQHNSSYYPLNANMAAALHSLGRVEEALIYYHRAMENMPNDPTLINNYGALMGIMGRKEEEVAYLQRALESDPYMESALVNLASYYQGDGQLDKAAEYLERAANVSDSSTLLQIRQVMMLSVVSSSWEQMLQERQRVISGLQRFEAEYRNNFIKRISLETSFDHIHFYIVYHGLNDRAVQELIVRVYHQHLNLDTVSPFLLHPNYPSLAAAQDVFRSALMPTSTAATDRVGAVLGDLSSAIINDSELLLHSNSALESSLSICAASVLDATSVAATVVTNSNTHSSNHSDNESIRRNKSKCRVRVGFLSKFFALFEPHGLLLDGVMRYLPRDQFEVIVLPIARSDGKPLSPTVVDAAAMDGSFYPPQQSQQQSPLPGIIEVSLTYAHALEMLQQLHLDVLIFGDVLSEPIAHFLTFARVAPIQIAFWGNPITSASQHMDFFVSSAGMEHPYRTRMPLSDEPYSEQVVLLQGQGIWYYRPAILEHVARTKLQGRLAAPKEFTRSLLGWQEDWFIYCLPQSVYKIHPLFDRVLARILRSFPSGHLVVTGGRQPRWTETYVQRLHEALGPTDSQRLHVLERVSSEQFDAMLQLADVVLHPFPFDGSRTSADALSAGKPLVTLPSEYLRGRMGLSFMRTLNLPQLVAHNASHYVDIAVRLGSDRSFLRAASERISRDCDLIWEDMEVPFEWTRLLQSASGISSSDYSLHKFLQQSGRNVSEELQRHERRVRNRREFDAAFGRESWLLDADGVARLQTHIAPASGGQPRIFEDWQSSTAALLLPLLSPLHSSSSSTIVAVDADTPVDPSVTTIRDPAAILSVVSESKVAAITLSETAALIGGNGDAESAASRPTRLSGFSLFSSGSKINSGSIEVSMNLDVKIQSSPEMQLVNESHSTKGVLHALDNNAADVFASAADITSSPSAMLTLASSLPTSVRDQRHSYILKCRQGFYDDAYPLAAALYEQQRDDPLYLTELGVIEFFRGNYQQAHSICVAALALAPTASLVHVCLGVSAMYLPSPAPTAELAGARTAVPVSNFASSGTVASALVSTGAEAAALSLERAFQLMREKREARVARGESAEVNRSMLPLEGRIESDGEIYSFMFVASLDSIEGNLLQAYRISKSHSQCLRWCTEQYHLPAISESTNVGSGGGEYVLLFAVVDWSPKQYVALAQLEQQLRVRGKLLLPQSQSLLGEIQRLQRTAEHIINPANECLNGLEDVRIMDEALAAMTQLIFAAESTPISTDSSSSSRGVNDIDSPLQQQQQHRSTAVQHLPRDQQLLYSGFQQPAVGRGVALVAQYFRASHPQLQADLDKVLTLNLLNDGIADVYLLTEQQFDFSLFPRADRKLHQLVVGERLTFRSAVRFANQQLRDRIVIIANADIYFDYTILRLSQQLPAHRFEIDNRTVLALLRWSAVQSSSPSSGTAATAGEQQQQVTINLRIDSQDAWIFRSPLRDHRIDQQHKQLQQQSSNTDEAEEVLLAALNFPMGVARCDNLVAHVLKSANYSVLNPAFAIRAIEIQSQRPMQLLYGTKNSVLGPGSNVLLSDKFTLHNE